MNLRVTLCASVGLFSGILTALFGEWDGALTTLIIFMIIDYISGIACAGIFHKSKKSESGSLKSAAGFKGLIKKAMILFFVLIGNRLDMTLQTTYIRDVVVYGFMANELLSLTENAALMGIPLPLPIKNAIDILAKKGENDEK